jgi:PKD repeat protein
LNLQHNGTAYFSSAVQLVGATHSGDTLNLNAPRTVQVDLSGVAPGTVVTLYLDLLGFGSRDSHVILDDVRLLTTLSAAPIASDDTATVFFNTPTTIDLLNNDQDPDGTLNPNTLQILSNPQNGIVTLNPDGTVNYTPNPGFQGHDQFIYIVQDNAGVISNSAKVSIVVANPTPVIETLTVAPTLSEGTPAQYSATASVATGGTLTYEWNFGDGSAPLTGQTLEHTYAQNGIYEITLTVTTTTGSRVTQSQTVTVNNIAPTVNAGEDLTFNEGQTITLNGTFTDPGTDTHTYSWNFGDGSDPVVGTLTPTHIYRDNGTYTVTLTVTDSDGAATSDTLMVTVNNVAPIITEVNGTLTLTEGDTSTFSATAVDPGNDTLTYTWNFGDNTPLTAGQTISHTYPQNGTYTVILTVTDKDGAASQRTFTVNVANAAPIVTLTPVAPSNEGQAITFNGSFTDAGVLDTHTVTWNFGDGTAPITGTSTPTHTYRDNGIYTIALSVTDSDGATTTQTLTVTVNNVAPTVNAGANQTSNEGQSVQFNGSFSDPGLADTHTLTWNFGDGSATVSGTLAPTHIYRDNGIYTATLTVTDKDGASTTNTLIVTVNNVAPTVDAGTDLTLTAGTATTFRGTLTDPGILDTHTYLWNFGNGTTASGTLTPTTTYTQPGTYTVTLTVTDKDGASRQDTLTVTVKPVALPTLTIADLTITEGDSQTTTATFTVTLSAPSSQPVTVAYTTANGTALAGTDYIATSGILTFAPGQSDGRSLD